MIRPASPAIVQRLKKSDDLVCWVHSKLDGMDIPQLQILQLPDKKRLQLALACWHVAIDRRLPGRRCRVRSVGKRRAFSCARKPGPSASRMWCFCYHCASVLVLQADLGY